jgi:hypothetical protein
MYEFMLYIDISSSRLLWLVVVAVLLKARGSVVVKALPYKPEGRGLDTRRRERFVNISLIISAVLSPGVYLASNRNEYQR